MNEAEKLINRLYGNIGFTCDSCGRETNGITYVNGMKFCAKCYQETFGKDNQQNEIQQLKQQLEEKDQQIKKRVMVYEKQFIVQTNEIYSLKQQLAEKDKEFEDWKQKTQTFLNRVNEQNYEIANNNPKQLAIHELEKAKDLIKHFCNIHSDEYYGVKAEVKGIELDVCEEIDNQIKVLKGE